jgi:hypothetical protein
VRGRSGLRIGAKRTGEEQWEEGMLGHSFIGLEGERGGQVTEGNGRRWWCAIMVVEAAVSGGDRQGWWWGVMRGGALAVFGVEGRSRDAACTSAREAAVVESAVRPREEDDRGGARVSVIEGRADWLGRPKAEAQWEGKRVVGWPGW